MTEQIWQNTEEPEEQYVMNESTGWFEDLNQRVWNVHRSLEWWTWFYNDEKKYDEDIIENCSRNKCQENHVWIEKVRAWSHSLGVPLLL